MSEVPVSIYCAPTCPAKATFDETAELMEVMPAHVQEATDATVEVVIAEHDTTPDKLQVDAVVEGAAAALRNTASLMTAYTAASAAARTIACDPRVVKKYCPRRQIFGACFLATNEVLRANL